MLSTLQRLAATEPRARRGRRPAFAWLAAALLLVVGGWVLARLLADPGEEPKKYLGSRVSLTSPIGPVESYAPFSWTYLNDRTETYRLRIYDADDAVREDALFEWERLKETTWTPDAKDLESLPARIFWTVEALDAQNVILSSGSGKASLSR